MPWDRKIYTGKGVYKADVGLMKTHAVEMRPMEVCITWADTRIFLSRERATGTSCSLGTEMGLNVYIENTTPVHQHLCSADLYASEVVGDALFIFIFIFLYKIAPIKYIWASRENNCKFMRCRAGR